MTSDLDSSYESSSDSPRRLVDDRDEPSLGDRARKRAYLREFTVGMVGYSVVLLGVVAWGGLDGTAPSRFVWALLPVVPAAWLLRAILRHLERLDEYQRALALRGVAVGFAVAMLTAVTLGMLASAGFNPQATPWIIYGAGMIGWAITSIRSGCQ